MKSRRFLFVAVLLVLLAAAFAIGKTSSEPRTVAAANGSETAAAASSDVWFCPGEPTTIAPKYGRLTLANVADEKAEVEVTDLADSGATTQTTLGVAAHSVLTKARASLGAPGALTIEAFGGRVLAEEGVEGPAMFESTPCATQAARQWFFAAGTTPRGVQQWLVLENPYASDAKVNVTLRTSSGVREPGILQSVDVAPRSRNLIALQNIAVREDRVATEVDAQVGSVVASQIIVYTADAGTPGVAQSLGSTTSAMHWSFAGGIARRDSSSYVAITNVGDDAAQVDIQAAAQSPKAAIAPASLNLAQDDVAWVQIGQCPASSRAKACISVPSGVRYSLDIRSESGIAIVAQTVDRFALADGGGTTSLLGGLVPATAWTFARSTVPGESETDLSFVNPGAVPASVSIGAVHNGRIDNRSAFQHLTVAPGRQVTIRYNGGRSPSKVDAALTVDSTVPIYAERLIVTQDEAGASNGVAG